MVLSISAVLYRGLFLKSKALMFEGVVGVYVNRVLLTVLFQMTGDVLVKL